MTAPVRLSRAEFEARLHAAHAARLVAAAHWGPLQTAGRVIVYTYGARGRDLALQLRARGIDTLVFDNGEAARRAAQAEGFEVVRSLDRPEPLIVGAGQNQIEILGSLQRPAFGLAETLYALDLHNQCAPARRFTDDVLDHAGAYFALYGRLDGASAAMLLQVLEYRASLDVRALTRRRPMGEMWAPPVPPLDIRSFCDVGAYDGDSLRATKALYPGLVRSFTIEPNPQFADPIARSAETLGVDNSHFTGVAWSTDARMRGRTLWGGMFVIEEDPEGDIHARSIDTLLGDEAFDFIKMDVEGTERQVIAGARKALSRARRVALAAYHLPADLRTLPSVVEAVSEGWNLAFAHYSQTFDDSIFYLWR